MSCFYMATRFRGVELSSPNINVPSSKSGYYSVSNFLNGGASMRQSVAAHKQYTFTWNGLTRDEARVVTDFADGVYGRGEVYIHDPITADKNVLPQWWATPSQGAFDGLPLNAGVRGTLRTTPPNSLGFPAESIEYVVTTGVTRNVWVPIPPGYVAWVGAYGEAVGGSTATVRAIPTAGPTNATNGPTDLLQLLDVTDDTRFTNNYSSASWDGVRLGLGGSGSVILTAIMVQVLPLGQTPEPGGFISGQGNSGLRFVSQPSLTPYSASLDRVGVVAEMVETGGWDEL
jgi:hypothetical protein